MAGLCKAAIIGNLGAPGELKYTQSGNPRLTFRVACNRVSTSPEGERREETEWFSVSVFRKMGETLAPLLNKGSKVYVEGSLRSRSWVGQDGEKRFSMEIWADNVVLLDPRPRGEYSEGSPEKGSEDPSAMDADQIPF